VEALAVQTAVRSAQSDQSRASAGRSGVLVEDVEGSDRQMQQCRDDYPIGISRSDAEALLDRIDQRWGSNVWVPDIRA
jgi:hypothetical protein